MRERDLIWDSLDEHFGPVRTNSERGRRNRAVRELRDAHATPAEIAVAVAFCRKSFTSFSEMAICNWFSRALQENSKSGDRDMFLRLLEQKSDAGQADEIITLLSAVTGGKAEQVTLDYYSVALLPLDYTAALSAATVGKDFWRFFPSWAEFREIYRIQDSQLRPKESPVQNLPPVASGKRIPDWVRRWIAARFLYKRFGKEQDMRPFSEMGDQADPTAEHMPPDEWLEEGKKIADEDVWQFLKSPISPDPEKTKGASP